MGLNSGIQVLRSYTLKQDGNFGRLVSGSYTFQVQSMVRDGKEARRLRINIKSNDVEEDYYFDADGFIDYYTENPPRGFMKYSSLAIWKIGDDYVQEYLGNYLCDRRLMFPITIIFQIILFIVMELYRYWRDRKKYEELENTFSDTIITYNDNEYMKAGEVEWRE